MAGFDDLIPAAMPYLSVEYLEATAGTTWKWDYLVKDDSEAAVDLTTGYTATMSIRTAAGVEVLAPTVTFPSSGLVRCSATAAATAAVAAARYEHELTITRTSDGAKIIAVGAHASTFNVLAKVS